MTFAGDMLAAALAVIQELGTTCTMQQVAQTYDPAEGTTTDTVTTYADVLCSDVVDESRRYSADTSPRATGTIYLPASGLASAPALSTRFVLYGRTFQAVAVLPMRGQGSVAAYRVDVAEVGNG